MQDLCIFLIFFCSKIILTQNFLLFAEINLTTRGPLYTRLVVLAISNPEEHLSVVFRGPWPKMDVLHFYLKFTHG